MPMNGGDWRSGSMQCGGAREEGMEVPTGARATIFAMGGKEQENSKPKRTTITQQEKRKQ